VPRQFVVVVDDLSESFGVGLVVNRYPMSLFVPLLEFNQDKQIEAK
jgi:hypothetical protein